MAITLTTAAANAARSAATDAITALLNAGSGSGRLLLRTAANAVAATLTFAATAFAAAVNGTAAANSIANDAAAAGNASAITNFITEDSDSNQVWSGSVGETGADINFTDDAVDGNVIIQANAVVSISSMSFTTNIA